MICHAPTRVRPGGDRSGVLGGPLGGPLGGSLGGSLGGLYEAYEEEGEAYEGANRGIQAQLCPPLEAFEGLQPGGECVVRGSSVSPGVSGASGEAFVRGACWAGATLPPASEEAGGSVRGSVGTFVWVLYGGAFV